MNHPWLILAILCSACGPDTIVPDDAEGETGNEFDPAVECGTVVDIDTEESRTCAHISTGRVRCWGERFKSTAGEFADEEFGDDEPAWNAPWLDLDVATMSLGRDVCGVTVDGLLACRDPEGTFFDDPSDPFITELVDFGVSVAEVSVGSSAGCALLDDASLRCWGDWNAVGVAADDLVVGDDEPASTVVLPSPATKIFVGSAVTCAVLETGEVACWGYGGECDDDGVVGCGTLGVPGVLESETPLLVELPDLATDVSVGFFNVCARFGAEEFTCWGEVSGTGRGEALGHIGDDESPAAFQPLSFGQAIEQLEVGRGGTCVLFVDGSVKCWGIDSIANPADPSADYSTDPFAVDPIPLPEPATGISVGFVEACAVGVSGAAYCWGPPGGALGYGHENVIGVDPTITQVQPVPVLDPRCDE